MTWLIGLSCLSSGSCRISDLDLQEEQEEKDVDSGKPKFRQLALSASCGMSKKDQKSWIGYGAPSFAISSASARLICHYGP